MKVRVSAAAREDVRQILRRSEAEFGTAARLRYRRLLDTAINRLRSRNEASRARAIQTSRRLFFMLPLKLIAKQAAGVRQPPHLLVYRVGADEVLIDRVLHERMDIVAHLESFDSPARDVS